MNDISSLAIELLIEMDFKAEIKQILAKFGYDLFDWRFQCRGKVIHIEAWGTKKKR